MTNTEQPVWKTYSEFPFIEANQFGEIRTIDRYVSCRNGGKRLIKGHVLKQRLNNRGYMIVSSSVNGKIFTLLVHRIIATCFIPNPNNLPEVNHIDNDPTNNAVCNLEWCTDQYNQDYKNNFGTSPAEVSGHPTIAVNPGTSKVFWFESQHEAARQLHVGQGNVNSVVNGKLNRTGGYWFTNTDESAVERTKEKFGDDIAKKVEKLMNENCN